MGKKRIYYQVISGPFAVKVALSNERHQRVIDAGPVFRKFVGQDSNNLHNWLFAKYGAVEWKPLVEKGFF